MRIWIAVVALVGLGACGEELSHRQCTVTTATSDEAIVFSVCGGERAEQDWKDQCAIHARGLGSAEEPLCFCEDAPGPCGEPGTREIEHVCPEDYELCADQCVPPGLFEVCDGECVATWIDDDNCGACGNVCPRGQRCDVSIVDGEPVSACHPCNRNSEAEICRW